MAIYNVCAPVVALVEADSAEEAEAKLRAEISKSEAFDLYDGGRFDTFESEALDDVEVLR